MSAFNQSFNDPLSCFAICNEKSLPQNAPVRQQLLNLPQADGMSNADLIHKNKEVDDLLCQALNGLTFEERQEQQEILHGVEATIAEEAGFIEALLQELDGHLRNIKSRSVYEMAESMDPGYVSARAFRVMFLRRNRYGSKAAADQMLKFFEVKLELFGKSKLVKDIAIDDLDEDDIACLKTGWIQLPGKDRSGRQISLNLPGLRGDNMTLQNELRVRYYTLMSMLESEETQIRGMIPMVYTVGDIKDRFGGRGYLENTRVAKAIPTRVAAVHICTDDINENLCYQCIIKILPLKVRANFRLHYGSHTECRYQLASYGIPQGFLPIDLSTNQVSLQRHLKWIGDRIIVDKSDRPLSSVIASPNALITPTENDVLLLIGGNRSKNLGNQRFRAVVKGMSQAYETGSKETRKDLAACVIHSVHDCAGRFLKQRGLGIWEELNKDQIRKTVTQAFRNSYRRR
mmetsp:Transcript_31706/g.76747  ORF Transcript_31706/g.76747 Transcript_31706/m.76747 type:complete len:459 (-) Transcript_31706:30-1406(-)